jgi:hypothetical protein
VTVALGLYFSPASMTTSQYDDCIAQLKKAGAGHPAGRQYHACLVSDGKVQVFDVWTSQEAFNKFGEVLLPIMQRMGLDPGQPMSSSIYNVIVPPGKPAKVAKAAKAAKKPAKRASGKKPAKKARRR